MRSAALWTSVLLLAPSILASNEYSPLLSPFSNPYFESEPDSLRFAKRQSKCQNGDTSCSNLGAADTCCAANTNCQADQAGNVACCPISASCTGTIKGLTATVSTTRSSNVFVAGGTGTTSSTNFGTSTSSSSSSFFFGSTTATTTTAGRVITTGSTVAGAPYPFYIIPTTFSAAAECSSYYAGCQTQFTSCTSALGVGVNGVTVSGGGGGTSVNGVSATSVAASVCSSLSTAACFGLQLSNCATYAGATGTITTENSGTTATDGNSFIASTGAAATRCLGGLYEIGMGVAVGVVGVLI